MRVTLRELAGAEYDHLPLHGAGPVSLDVFSQVRITGELELLVTITAPPGQEDLLVPFRDELPGTSRPLSPGASGDPLLRITQGWSHWPGDARAAPSLQMVTFRAFLPESVRSVTLDIPGVERSYELDLLALRRGSHEKLSSGLSFAYGQVRGVWIARVSYYEEPIQALPPFRIIGMGPEDGGVQFHGFEDRVDAEFATGSSLDDLLGYTVEPAREVSDSR